MGRVVWNPSKSLWNLGFLVSAAALAPVTFSTSAFVLFCGLTAFTLCVGHSVGLHRLLIHRSFRVPLWLEHALVTVGISVGMGGPLSMVRMHNTRDFFQNEKACDPFFAVEHSVLHDWWNSMHGRFEFSTPFVPALDPVIANDAYYQWLERHWRWLQVICAVVLFMVGGIDFVVWGVLVRVVVSVNGHWFVGFVTHADQPKSYWFNSGSAVQGVNSMLFGALSMGEGWHNNHHTFPRSAAIGILWFELDAGFMFIEVLEAVGLATEVLRPSLKTRFHRARVTGIAPRVVDPKSC